MRFKTTFNVFQVHHAFGWNRVGCYKCARSVERGSSLVFQGSPTHFKRYKNLLFLCDGSTFLWVTCHAQRWWAVRVSRRRRFLMKCCFCGLSLRGLFLFCNKDPFRANLCLFWETSVSGIIFLKCRGAMQRGNCFGRVSFGVKNEG